MIQLVFKFCLIWNIFFILECKAQLLNYDTRVRIVDHQKITERKFQIQVKSENSNSLSHIEIPHSNSQNFELIEAKIIDKKGNIVRTLKKKEIKSRSLRGFGTFYQDNVIKEFDLYWNEYPYLIEFSYELTTREYLNIVNWSPIYFYGEATESSTLKVEIPVAMKYNLSSNCNLNPEIYIKDGYQYLTWNLGHTELPKFSSLTPPINELIPNIIIVPDNFTYGIKGSAASWREFGQWQLKLNEGMDDLPNSEKKMVDELIQGIADKDLVIRRLYAYLQDKNTYINVAIDIGGLKSYSADYVCRNRYGDCKALTTYMKAMLNYVGIESYYTLINSGEIIERINKEIPSQQFDHVILSIPLDNDTLWLENTANFLPYNYLGTFTQGRFGLAIIDQNSHLIKTPALNLENTYEKGTYTYSTGSSDGWSLSVQKEFLRGKKFERFLYELKEGDEAAQKKAVLKEISVKSFKMTNFAIQHLNRNDHFVKISSYGKIKSPILEYGEIKVIQPIEVELPFLENSQERNLPVRISFPINKTITQNYLINRNHFKEIELPNEFEISSKFGFYKRTYKTDQKTIETTVIFQLYSGDYLIDEYESFLNFINTIDQHQKTLAIIVK